MGFIGTAAPFANAAPSYAGALKKLTSEGWAVVSEGPSGAQLRGPKQMRALDKWGIGIGVPLIVLWGVGLLLIAAGLIDYALLTPRREYFLSRENPKMPA
jgi:hypothetical protein